MSCPPCSRGRTAVRAIQLAPGAGMARRRAVAPRRPQRGGQSGDAQAASPERLAPRCRALGRRVASRGSCRLRGLACRASDKRGQERPGDGARLRAPFGCRNSLAVPPSLPSGATRWQPKPTNSARRSWPSAADPLAHVRRSTIRTPPGTTRWANPSWPPRGNSWRTGFRQSAAPIAATWMSCSEGCRSRAHRL